MASQASTVSSGANSTGTVALATPIHLPVAVNLFSSEPSVATVPNSVLVTEGNSAKFNVHGTAGGFGCTKIGARLGSTQQVQLLFVRPPANNSSLVLTLTPDSVTGGSSATGFASFRPPGLSLLGYVEPSSSNPSVSVRATAPMPQTDSGSAATFRINTTAVAHPGTCAIITAEHCLAIARALLKVGPEG